MSANILEILTNEWRGVRSFPAELQTIAQDGAPVKITVARMSWAERRAVFTAPDVHAALIAAIPTHIFLRDTDTPLFPGDPKDVAKTLSDDVDPAVVKELVEILLSQEVDLQATKN